MGRNMTRLAESHVHPFAEVDLRESHVNMTFGQGTCCRRPNAGALHPGCGKKWPSANRLIGDVLLLGRCWLLQPGQLQDGDLLPLRRASALPKINSDEPTKSDPNDNHARSSPVSIRSSRTASRLFDLPLHSAGNPSSQQVVDTRFDAISITSHIRLSEIIVMMTNARTNDFSSRPASMACF